jgi:hypothetical protein
MKSSSTRLICHGLPAVRVRPLTDLVFGRAQHRADRGKIAQNNFVAADMSRLKFSAKEE